MYMVEFLFTQSKTLETKISQLTRIPQGLDFEGHVNTITTKREKDTKSPKEVEKSNNQENLGIDKKLPTPPEKEVVKEIEGEMPYVSFPPYTPPIPFPQKFVKAKVEENFKKFLELL